MLRNTRRDRDSLPSSLLIWCNTLAPWRTTSTIRTNGNHRHFFIQIPILSHVLVETVELICCCSWIYIYIYSTLFQHQTNLLGSQGSKEAVKVPLLFCLMCAVQSGHVPFFLQYLPPTIVHLRNLFLLNTRVARMLLVSKRKDVK